MKKDKIYIVKYYGGSYEDYYETIIFATTSKSKAYKYRARFNRILKKWKKHYSQYETRNMAGMFWIGEEFVNKYYTRWSSLNRYTQCNVQEVELR